MSESFPSPPTRPAPGRGARRPSARSIALDVLSAVLDRRRPLEETLAAHSGFAGLEGRDRGFARLLLATTLRRLGQIDALIGHCLARPLPRAALNAQHILRLGVAQLLFLGTPPHAAVSASVDLADQAKLTAHKKLINAVLRRLSQEGAALRDAQDAARLNTPAWLWQSWSAAYGETATRAIATQHLLEPPLDMSLKPDLDPAVWAERLSASPLPNGTLRRTAQAGGLVSELPGFDDGHWWIQDAAASLPARVLIDTLDERFDGSAGRSVIDLCAAPGGKTAQLAAVAAAVTAVEASASRLARLRDNLIRLRLAADTINADATEWRPAGPVDAVLLDAPCSATGTIRRHPDIAWTKRAADAPKLTSLQGRLLANAIAMVKPGGVLVYAVCSLQPEEGPARIAALLNGGTPVCRLPLAAHHGAGLPVEITAEGDLRSLPCHMAEAGGMDGFYIARLVRHG
jgi:16S rRNA (cytosine967-C5)-methyltransferase